MKTRLQAVGTDSDRSGSKLPLEVDRHNRDRIAFVEKVDPVQMGLMWIRCGLGVDPCTSVDGP